MRNDRFLKQLTKELPLWVEQGWVKEDGRKAILDYMASQDEGRAKRHLTLAFSILGAVLLGAGIITFFAANWIAMSKLAKLGVLFGSMWLAYLAAYYLIAKKEYPYLGQAILLLGVILFGSNIMLIAQIYHIDSHYPNGVLLWSLGGILVAYLMGSQPSMVASMVLAILWTSMESYGFDQTFHWPFIIVWLASLPVIVRLKWKHGLQVSLIGLLIWSGHSFIHLAGYADWPKGSAIYLMQIYFVLYLGLFVLGMVMNTYKDLEPLSSIVRRYGAFAALISFHLLTYPDLGGTVNYSTKAFPRTLTYTWFSLTVIALVGVALLVGWHRQLCRSEEKQPYLKWGQALLGLVSVLLLVNIYVCGTTHGSLMAIIFNLLFVAGLMWLIYAGMRSDDRNLVNMAFLFFALTVLARYFDTFWSLMNRSFFFIAGGILLIGGGYYLERQRRQITQKMASRKTGEKYDY